MTSPADELRAAATKLRDTASKASGYTTPWHVERGLATEWLVGTPAPHLVASGTKPIVEWIALTSTALAEPLAAVLDDAASAYEVWLDRENHDVAERVIWRDLAVARVVNGGQQS